MPLALHFTFHTGSQDGDMAAADLQRCNVRSDDGSSQWEHRVVEMSASGKNDAPADLSCSQPAMPELLSALRAADQVHLYGADVDTLLNALPYVVPETLCSTPLTVHGPCGSYVSQELDESIPRLGCWPGPVHYDEAASLSLNLEPSDTKGALDRLAMDPWHHDLTPRIGEVGAIAGLAQEDAVIVCLSRRIPESVRQAIRQQVERYFDEQTGNVDVGWVDEAEISRVDARAHRRLAQLFIAGSWSDPGCIEAMLVCTPLWVLDQETRYRVDAWFDQLGVQRMEHRLADPETPEFAEQWKRAIQGWSNGESLPVSRTLREMLLERCRWRGGHQAA